MIPLVLAVLLAQETPGVVLLIADEPVDLAPLAARGVSLGRFYAAAPVASAARAGLLTGAFPSRRRVNYELQRRPGNAAYGQDDWLDPKGPVLPRLFKDAGYATGHAGPWRLAPPGDPDAPPLSAYGVEEADPLDFLRRHAGRPFFLCVATNEPARIWNALDDRTYVIATSDTGPLKHSLYERALRVPFVARGPGLRAGARDDASVVAAVDLLPTLAALAGLKPPDGLDGEDRSAVLRGTPSPRAKPLFWEYGRGPNYLLPRRVKDRSPGLAVLEGPWKLHTDARGRHPELYDLESDPSETKDVAALHPERVERLKTAALAWRMSLP